MADLGKTVGLATQADEAPVLTFKGLRPGGSLNLSTALSGRFAAAQHGDVVFTKQGHVAGWVMKKVGLVPPAQERIHVASTLQVFRPSTRLLPEWLYLWLSAPQTFERVQEIVAGRNSLTAAGLRQILVPCPPVDEQRRIVDLLESHLSHLDAASEATRRAARRLTSLRAQSVARHLLGADAASSTGPPDLEPAGVDDGVLPSLGKGWSWHRLHEIADVVGGVTKDAKKQDGADFVEVPYLRVANVQRGRLDLARVTTIRVPETTAIKLRLCNGDVLLNEGGDRDKLGRGWVWQEQVPNCIHQNHVFRARVRDNLMEPELLSWAANTVGGPWCERNGKQSVNLASISLSKIRLMPVPVPPRDWQIEILQRIRDSQRVCQRLQQDVDANTARSGVLRRALLACAFEGRLTSGRSSEETAHV